MTRIVGVEHECKWTLDYEAAAAEPMRWLDSPALTGSVGDLSAPVTATQGVVYLDDDRRRLTEAGHCLRIAANQGALSGIAWIGIKQTVHWDGRRDALEISERIDPAGLTAALATDDNLPLRYARRHGLIDGPVSAAGITSQRRTKRLGRLAGRSCSVTVDLVEFRRPDGGIDPIGRYACLEIEINDSAPAAVGALDDLGHQIDAQLGVPRESRTKAQLAVAAADSAERAPAVR